MEKIFKNLKNELNKTITANGDVAYQSTFSKNLDYFYGNSSFKNDDEMALQMFEEAMLEDPILAVKNLLYLRDIANGAGIRRSFKITLRALAEVYPIKVAALFSYITDGLGRWDDILSLIDVPSVKPYLVEYVKNQLSKDMESLIKEDEGVSLLGKWLPSVNTSSIESRKLGKMWAKALGLDDKTYRKTLSALREKIRIIENNLREKNYTFDYKNIPAKAMKKYTKAFMRNDEERFKEFVNKATKDTTILEERAKKLYPHEIITMVNDNRDFADAMWKSIKVPEETRNTIVVLDTSGSMSWSGEGSVRPCDVANSLAILFSENLRGAFKNKFIMFSSNPHLVELKGTTLSEKVTELRKYNDCSNTNIEKVYRTLLKASVGVPKEEQIERIVILSDMQFDMLSTGDDVSVTEAAKKKFEENGLVFPELVFWNCAPAGFSVPTSDLDNVKLVSGDSAAIMKAVIEDTTPNAADYMKEVLSRYSFVDDIWKD